jgi:hypothetical protein
MRRIALLSTVALLAACGGSTGTGNLRVANLAPDLVAAGAGIDFCIVPTGGSFAGKTGVMASVGTTGAAGLIYGGTSTGSVAVSKYFPYSAGNYDVRVIGVGLLGSTCENPLLSLNGVVINGDTSVTVGAIGHLPLTGAATGGHALRAWTDTATVATGKVAARFINTGFLSLGTALVVLPVYDIVQALAGGNNVLLSNIAYPGPGTGAQVDANGYIVADPSILTGATLYACSAGIRPPDPRCAPFALPAGFGSVANKVASVFNVGSAVVPPGTPTPPLAILCGDNEPALPVPYSACVGQ